MSDAVSGEALSQEAIRDSYDRLGRMQDILSFHGAAAVNELIAHAEFETAKNLFEFGCGTGKFAARLLDRDMDPQARYLGFDISPVMINLAKKRLAAYPKQAQVLLSERTIQFPPLDEVADRIISLYVLELLPETDIARFFEEAHRALTPDGKVCLVSLHEGQNVPSRIVSEVWRTAFLRHPSLVGGCRPIDLSPLIDRHRWQVAHRKVLAPFGVASEVWILEKRR